MNDAALFAIILLVSIIAVSLGYVVAALRTRHQIDDIRQKYADLNDKLASQKSTTSEKLLNMEKMRDGLENSLSSLMPNEVTANLNNKDQFVQTLLRPLQESLRNTDQQAKRIIREGQKSQRHIQRQLEILHSPQQLGRGNVKEIKNLLGDSDTRNRWGIKTLKDLLELTSMTDHYRMRKASKDDFKIVDDNNIEINSPPCLIQLPNNSQIAIDPNIPLEAYVNTCQASEASIRGWHMESHARKLRERIMDMSSQSFISQYEDKPAVQILMILNEHYLAAALEIDDDLLQLAQKHKLILATPTDLFNLLQTISYSWRQHDFADDAIEIRETGINLYKRFGTFIKLIAELGSELGNVLSSYNRAVSVFGNTAATAKNRMQSGDEISSPFSHDDEDTKKSA